MADTSELPYRANVGIVLFDGGGRVLIARRLRDDGPEIITPGCEWQMPQGGIDPGEEPVAAARRELWEETGVTSAAHVATLDAWIAYDFPPYAGPPHRLALFRGQVQCWVAFRFTGDVGEIDVAQTRNGAEPEFSEWRWEGIENLPALVVSFKRETYGQVVRYFQPFGDAIRAARPSPHP